MRESNKTFAKRNPLFRKCCELADLNPTPRQASKFRRQTGRAIRHRAEAKRALSHLGDK